jgi:hypothetical protein
MNVEPSPADMTIVRLTLDTSPWLSCDDCFEKLDEYIERTLTDATDPDATYPQAADTDEAMRRHLAGCPACAEEAESLAQLLQS